MTKPLCEGLAYIDAAILRKGGLFAGQSVLFQQAIRGSVYDFAVSKDDDRSISANAYCDGHKFTQNIPLSWSPSGFGGRRAWLACPLCAGRSRRLYVGSQGFACRPCLNLGYATQRMTATNRAFHRATKLWARIGCNASGTPVGHPHGLHPATVARLDEAATAAYMKALGHIAAETDQLEALTGWGGQ